MVQIPPPKLLNYKKKKKWLVQQFVDCHYMLGALALSKTKIISCIFNRLLMFKLKLWLLSLCFGFIPLDRWFFYGFVTYFIKQGKKNKMKYPFMSLKEFEFTLIEYKKKKLHCPVFPSYNLTNYIALIFIYTSHEPARCA